MKPRQVSIAFQTDKSPAEYIGLAKLVNLYDFDIVSVYCDAPFHPSYGPLLLMAPHIERARLGPAAVSPFRIHPIDIAANTALLAQAAPGGAYIGLARGAWLAEHGIQEPHRPLRAIREAITVIRKLLSGETTGTFGKHFRIAGHVRAPYPIPAEQPPLMLGTWGPKMAALAGELADEIKVGGSANPALVPLMLTRLQAGEKKAKRLGATGLVMGAVTVVDDDRDLARSKAKNALALYLPVVAALDPTINLEPELIQRIDVLVKQGYSDQAADLISDDLLEAFTFAGNPADLVRQAESLFNAGVSRIEFGTPHGLTPETGIRLLGEQVLPRLKC